MNLWNKIKDFFKHSVTILAARLTAVTGFIIAAIGAMNWGPLLGINVDTGFSRNQIIWLGGIAVFQGIIFELARRRTLVSTSS